MKRLEKRNTNLKTVISSQRSDLKRKASSIAYKESKMARLADRLCTEQEEKAEMEEKAATLGVELQEKEKEIGDTIEENEWLREMVQDTLVTKDESGAYTAELKECVYKLLGFNVSTRHVSNVKGAVLKLAGKKAEDLPSK